MKGSLRPTASKMLRPLSPTVCGEPDFAGNCTTEEGLGGGPSRTWGSHTSFVGA